jgi:hypothetical protein
MGTMVGEIKNGCYRNKSTTGLYRRVTYFKVVEVIQGDLKKVKKKW